MNEQEHVPVTYIKSTLERVWAALTSPKYTRPEPNTQRHPAQTFYRQPGWIFAKRIRFLPAPPTGPS